MRTSLIKLSSSIFLLTLTSAALAKPVAQVVDVSGSVFVITPEGKTSALKVNQHLEEKSEVMVEEGATVTLNDYYDATYHLSGGSHLKFFNQSVQLKKGRSWVQSMNAKYPLALTTANGHVDYSKGEFITTFDQATNRSQVLVVTGEVEVSNILNRNMKYTVPAGTFSVVDPEIENGIPRSPTRVGHQSLEKALAEFKKLPQKMLAKTPPSRAIASAEIEKDQVPAEAQKKGEIIFITSHRLPASVKPGSAHHYYKKVVQKKSEEAPVPIKIYGIATPHPKVEIALRNPASVQVRRPSVLKVNPPKEVNDHEFSESLKKQELEQPKYSKELQSLIDELKSY